MRRGGSCAFGRGMRSFLLPPDDPKVNLPRSSGILLHPTSLPGGRLGPDARRFVDWLQEAGQSWWQVLPLGPPDGVGSPYTSASAFAGWRGLLAEPNAPVSTGAAEESGVAAGVPPDYFSRTGQRWGNPIYDWVAMRASGYRWWVERFRRTVELFDLVRIDHFRGLVAYWAVPERHRTARGGAW